MPGVTVVPGTAGEEGEGRTATLLGSEEQTAVTAATLRSPAREGEAVESTSQTSNSTISSSRPELGGRGSASMAEEEGEFSCRQLGLQGRGRVRVTGLEVAAQLRKAWQSWRLSSDLGNIINTTLLYRIYFSW